MNGKFIAYYRVSTESRARVASAWKLNRQPSALTSNGGKWRMVAEFTEIESGKRADRLASLRYDLSKLRAKGLIAKVPRDINSCRTATRFASTS